MFAHLPRVAERLGLAAPLLAVLAWAAPALIEADDTRYALVIGLNDYGGSAEGIRRLGYAKKDAVDIEQALRALGYKMLERPLINEVARRRDIVRALSLYADTLTENDTFVLFFAGHGVRGRNGQPYWLTRDTSLGLLEENGVRLGHLMDYVRDVKAKKKLVLLDHCFSGDVGLSAGGTRSLDSSAGPTGAPRAGEGAPVVVRGVARVSDVGARLRTGASGFFVLAAAREEAYESDQMKQGIFTSAVLEALRTRKAAGNDAILTVFELLSFVGRRVQELGREKSLPDQDVYPVADNPGISDWEIGKPSGGDPAAYLETLRRWEGRGWITTQVKMDCKRIIDKWAKKINEGGPDLTPEEALLLQRIQGHMQYREGAEEEWAKELQDMFEQPPPP